MTLPLILSGYALGAALSFRFFVRAFAHMSQRILGRWEVDGADLAASGYFSLLWPIAMPLIAFLEYGHAAADSRFVRWLIGKDGAA